MTVPEVSAVNVISQDWGETPNDFWIIIQADIGVKGELGSDVFTFYVTSPHKLESILMKGRIKTGRGLLIMNDFDIRAVEGEIEKIVSRCTGATWNEVAQAVSRYAFWEYESYTEI